MKFPLIALVVFCTVPNLGHAATRLPENRMTDVDLGDCDALLGRAGPARFNIDEMSSRDIDIDALVAPAFTEHLTTSLGRQRLRWLLHHPSLDAVEIVERQRAVEVLGDRPDLRRVLRERLRKIEVELGDAFEPTMTQLRERHASSSRAAGNVAATILPAGLGLDAYGVVTTFERPMQALPIPLMIAGVGIQNSEREEKRRARLRMFKPLLAMASASAPDLSSIDDPVLARIADGLAAVNLADHALAEVRRRVNRLAGPGATSLLGMFFLSNRGTYAVRDTLVRNYDALKALAATVADLDVLVGLAEFRAAHRDRTIFPEILTGDSALSIRAGHHPLLWSRDRAASVANDVDLSLATDAPRFLLLTGPNTGGKSTYLKMIASSVLLAQIGAPVPAASMSLTPFALLTNKNVSDQLAEGESSFFAQGRRVADLFDREAVHANVLMLMDEIVTGTSPEEHWAIERSIIEELAEGRHVALLATHDRKLQKLEPSVPGVVNIHVDERGEANYRIARGPSTRRNAIEVLRSAGVRASIVDRAQKYLNELE